MWGLSFIPLAPPLTGAGLCLDGINSMGEASKSEQCKKWTVVDAPGSPQNAGSPTTTSPSHCDYCLLKAHSFSFLWINVSAEWMMPFYYRQIYTHIDTQQPKANSTGMTNALKTGTHPWHNLYSKHSGCSWSLDKITSLLSFLATLNCSLHPFSSKSVPSINHLSQESNCKFSFKETST